MKRENKMSGCDSFRSKCEKNDYAKVVDESVESTTKPLDAFQLMMVSRKKIIGSNSPGKNSSNVIEEKDTDRKKSTKRKLFLEAWALKKGGHEAQQNEVLREQSIRRVLRTRKKKFKKMLQIEKCKTDSMKFKNESNSLTSNQTLANDQLDNSSNNFEHDNSKPQQIKLPTTGILSKTCDVKSETDKMVNLEGKIKRRRGRPRKNISKINSSLCNDIVQNNNQVVNSHDCLNTSQLNSLKKSKDRSFKRISNKIIDSESDEEFLSKLSSPSKKKTDMYSYFKKSPENKVESNNLVATNFISRNDISLKNCYKSSDRDVGEKSNVSQSRLSTKLKESKNSAEKSLEFTSIKETENEIKESTIINDNNIEQKKKTDFKLHSKYKQTSSMETWSDDCSDITISSDSDKDYILAKKKMKKHFRTKNGFQEKRVITNNVKIFGEKIVSPIKIINILSPDTMKCIKIAKENSDNPPRKKMKLAPLFLKSSSKTLIDPSVLQARKDFLYSSSPEISEKLKKTEISCELQVNEFPVIFHIQQIPDINDSTYYVWDLPIIAISSNNLSSFESVLEDLNIDNRFLSSLNQYDLKSIGKDCEVNSVNTVQFYDLKEGLKKIKSKYPKFPVYKFFKRLFEKFSIYENSECNIDNFNNRSIIIDDGSEDCSQKSDKSSLINKNNIWTEKYKPVCSDDIIGNFKSVELLKNWLLSWKECRHDMISNIHRKRQDSGSSDDFVCSDSESSSSSKFPNSVNIVIGPNGCGKTSTIYAIANELDMNILEVNASSKRTGKNVLVKLQEATQSHKVLTEKDLEIAKNFERSSSKPKLKSMTAFKDKNEHKCKFANKSKHKSSNVDSVSQKIYSDTNKMSIILIEDVDIVFDEDDGFIPALTQIVYSSKRPVILVTSDLKCRHLKKFATETNVIKFHELSGKIIGPWLDILIFIETGKILSTFSEYLINFYKGDMRKTILQLQSWILGGVAKIRNKQIINLLEEKNEIMDRDSFINSTTFSYKDEESNFEWDINCENSIKPFCNDESNPLSNIICFSNREAVKWNISKAHGSLFSGPCDKKKININGVSDVLDIISSIYLLRTHENILFDTEICLSKWTQLSDSLSISENFKEYTNNFVSHCCESIIHCCDNLKKCSLNINILDTFLEEYNQNKFQKKQHEMDFQFLEAVPLSSQLDRRSLTLDYMPCLRNICRSEKSRCDANIKRNNRFYHYLTSLNVDAKDSLFDDACKIFPTVENCD